MAKTEMIRNDADALEFFGADTEAQMDRNAYKYSDCTPTTSATTKRRSEESA